MSPLARLSGPLLLVPLLAAAAAAQGPPGLAPPPSSPFLQARFVARPPLGPAPLEVHFVDRSLGDVSAWSWDFGDGARSSETSPRHTYLQGGMYTVRLTVRRRDGTTHTLEKPDGVVVTSCSTSSARANGGFPLELDEDFVPVTGDDRLGFYVVYSGKAQGPGNPGTANNVGLFLFPLQGDEVLLFGSGYGDANALVQPTASAAWDVQRVDALIRQCLGGRPGRTRVRFVAPHGHLDHINADCVRELRARGYEIPEIVFHEGDEGLVRSLPGWTAQDQAAFRTLRGATGQCQEELLAYASPLGKIWFYSRPGHTPGSIDLALDIGNDPGNRMLVRGSAAVFGSCPISGAREAIDPHGNVLLSAIPPVLESASPPHASALGGTPVALFGTGFTARGAGTPSVLVDGVEATQVTVHDDGALTCLVPPGPPGRAAELRVITRNGATRLEAGLTYRPLPTLTAIEPDHGLSSGGTPLVLRGTGFQDLGAGPAGVLIGGLPAVAIRVLDDRTLQCLSPAAAPGVLDVRLENRNGSALLAQALRIDPVVEVIEVRPAGATSLGGTRLVVNGAHFAVGSTIPRVFFGTAEASNVVRTSDLQLQCTAPPGPGGSTVEVRVEAENGSHGLPGAFRYFPTPEVTVVEPASGPARGGESVTVRGLNFSRNAAGPCLVRFGGVPATDVNVLSDGALTCSVPPGPGGAAVDVEVLNGNGSAAASSAWRYLRPPSLLGVLPEHGTHLGGTLVTLAAQALLEPGAGPPQVTFDGLPATAIEVQDDGSLRCRTPPGSPGARVEVRLANAHGEAYLPQAFQYVQAPIVSALSPSLGAAIGGQRVTLLGAGFLEPGAGLPSLRLGALRAGGVRILDDTQLSFETPPGPPGRTVDLVFENAFGRARLAGAFRYQELPALAAVEPGHGPTAGGTRITVLGRGFLAPGAGLPRVRLGGRSATSVVVWSDGRLTCDTPPGPPGACPVQLHTAWGDALLPAGFVYGAGTPTLERIEPASGPAEGGTRVTVHGSGFASLRSGTNRIFFGAVEATGLVVLSDRLLTALVPPGPPGARLTLEIRNVNGSATLPDAWRYHLQPALTSVSPDHGTALGGVSVALRGTGFLLDDAGANRIAFGAQDALDVVVLDDTRITCRTPAALPGTSVDVRLVNANGSSLLAGAFRHHAAPTLDRVAPDAGPRSGGTPVTLSGSGFAQGPPPTVRFGGLPAGEVAVLSDSSLTCRSPLSATTGAVTVTLETTDGLAEMPGAFRYFSAPRLTTITPASGPAAGGTAVLLAGQGFQIDVIGPNQVTFDGVPATQVSTLDDTRVRAWAPPGVPGSRARVELLNSNGSAAFDGFRYHARPQLSGLNPAAATALGGVLVTLQGSGFLSDGAGPAEVLFGDLPAQSVNVLDDATLTCRTPVGTPGTTVTVLVTNANGSSAPGPDFRFFPAPQVLAVAPPHGFSGARTAVEITGSGFSDGAPGLPEVRFGARSATAVTVLDDTHLTCLAPTGSSGPVAIELRTSNGLALLPEAFTYDWAPTLLGVAPATGSALGGTTVELTGAGLALAEAGPLSVRFGANPAAAVEVLGPELVRCRAPSGPAGATVSVTLSNAHGESSLPAAWRYHPRPTLDAIQPSRGPATGGTTVTLSGSGFLSGEAGSPLVSLGGSPATSVMVLDDRTLTCVTPPGPERSSGTIVLGNANGSATLPDAFRWSGRALGDLDDDGLADLVVGGSQALFVRFSGAPLGYRTSAETDLRLLATEASDFGACSAVADLNDDGWLDLIVGAPGDGGAGSEAGAVHVFFGPLAPAALPLSTADAGTVLRGQAARDRFGSSLAVGDLNGDGRSDLAVGAPGNDTAASDAGAVYVFLGGAAWNSRSAALADARFDGADSPDGFGTSLATGDIDGDSRTDLVVGAPFHKAGASSSGAVYLFLGRAPVLGSPARLATAEFGGLQSNDQLGAALAVGDLDGDGLDDIAIGAPEADLGASAAGGVFLMRGVPSPTSASAAAAAAVYQGEERGDRLGSALAMGDLNGDGLLDLLLGAPQHDLPSANSGRAYAVLGGSFLGGPVLQRAAVVFTAEDAASDLFGSHLAALDLDGDGRAEALIAAPFHDGLGPDSGRVYVFDGTTPGAARAAQGADGMLTGSSTGLLLGRSLARER